MGESGWTDLLWALPVLVIAPFALRQARETMRELPKEDTRRGRLAAAPGAIGMGGGILLLAKGDSDHSTPMMVVGFVLFAVTACIWLWVVRGPLMRATREVNKRRFPRD